jgi:hypothetical protein
VGVYGRVDKWGGEGWGGKGGWGKMCYFASVYMVSITTACRLVFSWSVGVSEVSWRGSKRERDREMRGEERLQCVRRVLYVIRGTSTKYALALLYFYF